MKVTLHLEGTRQEIVAQLDEARLVYTSSLEAQPAKGAKKAAKSKKPKDEDVEKEEDEDEEESADDSDEEEDSGLGEDDGAGDDANEPGEEDEDEEEESEEDDEEEAPKAPKKEAVVKALKTFAAKGEKFKTKAMAALGSFKSAAGKKVKHVDDMKKADYASLLKKLK